MDKCNEDDAFTFKGCPVLQFIVHCTRLQVDVHENSGDAGPRNIGRPGLASLSSSGTITSSMAASTNTHVDGGTKPADSTLTRNSAAAASDPIPIKGQICFVLTFAFKPVPGS